MGAKICSNTHKVKGRFELYFNEHLQKWTLFERVEKGSSRIILHGRYDGYNEAREEFDLASYED